MSEKITVIGHKAPDTDTVCSAIAYAWLLNKIGKPAESFVAGEINRETEFILKHFGLSTPQIKTSLSEGEKLVIVDTNNPEEIIDGLAEADLLEIIDHHKLSGLKTDSPVKVKISTVGSTATLIYRRAKYEGVEPEKNIAGILLAAILSDTLAFTSPTTTDEEKKAAEDLATIAGVDPKELAEKMFEAKSDLTGMDPKEILLTDSKVFEMGDKKVRISVHETTKPENAKSMKDDFAKAISEIKNKESLDGMFFFIVDILKSEASLLASGEEEKEKAGRAFESDYQDFLVLPGVVSRKKQMVPPLEKAYSS